jgi:hypothetical protein
VVLGNAWFPVVPIFIYLWSNDFEPNKSTKANRQSVWIQTCTVVFCNAKGENVCSTYPLCIGKKGDNHDVIEQKLADEIKYLFGCEDFLIMYSRFYCSPVYVHCEIFTVLCDQLEQRTRPKCTSREMVCSTFMRS